MSKIRLRIPIRNSEAEVVVFYDPSINGVRGKDKVALQRNIVNSCVQEILNISDLEIEHHESGAPYINSENMPSVSISHSQSWFAIQLNKIDHVGVDIQVIKEDISKGLRYFVNEFEEKNLELSNVNLNIIWAAKEAVYKFKKGDLEFYKEAMTVLEIKDNMLTVKVGEETVECSVVLKEDFVLVFVV